MLRLCAKRAKTSLEMWSLDQLNQMLIWRIQSINSVNKLVPRLWSPYWAMNSDETGRKIALAGALLAGFAYFGVSILRDIFHANKKNTDSAKSGRKRRVSENQTTMCSVKEEVDARHCLSHASSQTDLTLPIGVRHRSSAFRNVPPELWTPWAKTIEERIRELNIRLVNTTNFQYRNYGKHFKPKNCYNLGNTSGDQLSAQNSLKINIKFLTAYWTLIFIPWQLYFSCDYSLTIPYFSFFPLIKWSIPCLSRRNRDNWSAEQYFQTIFAGTAQPRTILAVWSSLDAHRLRRSPLQIGRTFGPKCGNKVSDWVPTQSAVKP